MAAKQTGGKADVMTALEQFVDVLEKTQWMGPDELAAYQRKTLAKVLRHAYETVPFYRDRLAVLFDKDGTIGWDRWDDVPLLTRSDIQDHGEALISRAVPASHGAAHATQSSGTSGSPIEVKLTMTHEVARAAAGARLLDWHGVDRRGKLATIRPLAAGEAAYPDGERVETWPEFQDQLSECGPFLRLNSNTSVDLQAEWVARHKPDYLYTLASNAGALAAFIEDNPKVWKNVRLKKILSYAEVLTDDVRERCRRVFGLDVIDCYSARECGYIALQCPERTVYHLQDEIILTEVLDTDAAPCRPRQTGRVVVTPLYNFAMPLIRYEIRDYAELGEPCSCGRAHRVLTRIAGRTRNMFRLPGGRLIAPDFKTPTFIKYLSPRQWQVAQTGPADIEIRLVPDKRDTDMDFDAMTAYVRKLLGNEFSVRYKLLAEIALRPGGKHEDYVCELKDMEKC